MDWILPVEMQLNGALVSDINTATCGETNTILYAFNNDLSPALDISRDTGETDKPTCPKGEYLDLSTGECVKSTCPVGQFLLGAGNCVACPTEGHSITLQSDLDDNSCTVCDGGQVWGGAGTSYACYYCPKPRVVCGEQCCAEGTGLSGNWKLLAASIYLCERTMPK